MASLAIALGAKLGIGGAAAAGASGIGGAAAAGLGSIGGGVAAAKTAAAGTGILGKLWAGTTALSAFSSFAGGMADKRVAQEQALEARMAANQSILQGAQQSNEILDGVVDRMAKTRVAYATAGLDAFSATPSGGIARLARDGERDIDVVRSDALMSYFANRRSMKALKARGGAAGILGVVQAASTAGMGYAAWKNR